MLVMSPMSAWLALVAVWAALQSPLPPVRQAPSAIPRDRYIGSEACRSCHTSLIDPFLHTAHALTSQPATRNSIRGTFTQAASVVPTLNPALSFRMETRANGFFLTAVTGTPPNTTTRSERFDIVIGSGRRGQTYLWWNGNRLFSLPVRYWGPSDEWVAASGFRDGVARFDVPPPASCLDCHVTSLSTVGNGYDRDSLMFGISCEKCHGPGRDHVVARLAKTPVPAGRDVVNPAHLSRERRMDVCAICHSEAGGQVAPRFSYVSGEPLEAYVPPSNRRLTSRGTQGPQNTPDVHGRQVDLLKMSRCFQLSPTMTCETCHDAHQTQRDLVALSARCLTCHKTEACGLFPSKGRDISGKCVDCHMPQQPSALGTTTAEGFRPAVLRTHWIKAYPEVRQP